MLRRQVGESEGEVQVLLGQLAVQSRLAVSSSQELTHLHDLIRKHENQIRLVSHAAVQSKLAVSSSQELLHLHDLIRKHENQIRLVSHAAFGLHARL